MLKDRRVRGFNSLFAADSIGMAKQYYAEFQRQQAERGGEPLKIALIYSFAPNEADPGEQGFIDDEDFETAGLDQSSRDFLDAAICDYNRTFGSSFSTASDQFENYYKDLCLRLKNRDLDMAIVVNMLLTGFDATTLNTLWVDKNLKQHGLMQAFSRTNRILNSVKTFGNIVCFRDLRQEVDDALALFGDKDAKGTVVLKPYVEYLAAYNEKVSQLLKRFPLGEEIVGPEHVARNRKQLSRDAGYSGYDDDVVRGGKRSRMKKPSAQQMMAPIKIEHAYMSGDTIVVRDLCEKIGKTSAEIIKKLFLLGNMATINSEIDFDTASLVCADFDITLEKKPEVTAEDQLTAENFDDSEENLQPRPPVVTIMGHVDHGKTSLLDYIRNSRVTAGEAGGITQHIGAYTVKMNGRDITFLDTPGHEAFTAMRARGAQATDIAILVVAADDSVMPQTIEAINHAKAANVPIIVAINKMDKPEADPERVKTDLTKYGIVCEDWGGDTIMCPVSAKTGEGVDELLEMILLQADTMELRANPNRLGRGVIIEAKLDKARGPLATVLMQNGTLHVGDNIIAGLASGRVRALINDRGEKVKEAGPSTPVEIMGFDEVPSAGDEMQAVGDDRLSRQVAEERKAKVKASREATMAKVSLENMFSNMESGKQTTLNLIIKADVQGSVEAVKQAMEKLSSDEVKVHVLPSPLPLKDA